MNCAEVTHRIALYSYGEVFAEMEEKIESHLADCADCRQALARHRSFLQALDQREDAADGALLADCRRDLRLRLSSETERRGGWLEALRRFAAFHIPFKVPVGAMALIARSARGTPRRDSAALQPESVRPCFPLCSPSSRTPREIYKSPSMMCSAAW
jgi:hypothetical protein